MALSGHCSNERSVPERQRGGQKWGNKRGMKPSTKGSLLGKHLGLTIHGLNVISIGKVVLVPPFHFLGSRNLWPYKAYPSEKASGCCSFLENIQCIYMDHVHNTASCKLTSFSNNLHVLPSRKALCPSTSRSFKEGEGKGPLNSILT